MPLLPAHERISAAIDADTQLLDNYLTSAATVANRIAAHALNASNDDLAEWLNSQGPELMVSFERHLTVGNAINTAAETVAAMLESTPQTIVDTRPFAEKLADQGRVAAFVDGIWTVTNIPPAQE